MQPHFVLADSAETRDVPYRRTSSLSPIQTRTPPRRDRTPIQRHRRSIPRDRSHSRSDLLLPYAAEHQQIHFPPATQANVTVVPSQSAPTTPQIYTLPPTYAGHAGPGPVSYGSQGGYFSSTVVQPEVEQTQDFDFRNDQRFDGFYMLSRSTSSSVGIPELAPQEGFLSSETTHPIGGLSSIPNTLAAYPPLNAPLESSAGGMEILPSRPKPQCWDHGCNGRQFSTFSNLLRHQREKSGSALKAVCPHCGTEFTRTTARNGHMYGGKCRAKESSEPSPQESSKSS